VVIPLVYHRYVFTEQRAISQLQEAEVRDLAERYRKALLFLRGNAPHGVFSEPSAEEEAVEFSSRPLLKIRQARDAFRHAAKSYTEQPIFPLCGIADFTVDVLHMHIHQVGNAIQWFAEQINRLFDSQGHLKDEQAYKAWKAPTSATRNSADTWRKGGMWLFDLFERFCDHPALKGKLPACICMQ
jgi:hypothetical protein